MRTTVLVLVLLFTAVSSSFATAQAGDILIFQGERYRIFTNPMEVYFAEHPEKRPQSNLQSSGLWRGYVATFEIVDSTLNLADIKVEMWRKSERDTGQATETYWISVKDDLAPVGETFALDWYTGLLVIPQGEIVEYVHMDYASLYRNYILLEIRDGKLIRVRKCNYWQYARFRKRQFQAFKRTEEYKEAVRQLIDTWESRQEIDDFIRECYVSDYGSLTLDNAWHSHKDPHRAK